MHSIETFTKLPFSHEGVRNFHVTLIRPPAVWKANSVNTSSLTPPLALAYLSASLRKAGFSVANIDSIGEGLDSIYRLERNPKMEALGLTPPEIISRIPLDTNLIGVSCMFSLEWPNTRNLIWKIKTRFPNVPLIVGGEHVSAMPEFSMNECLGIDYICMGEGDDILVNFCERLSRGETLDSVNGIWIRIDGKPTRSTSQCQSEKKFKPLNIEGDTSINRSVDGASGSRIKNLDEIPWPAWDMTPVENYLNRKMSFGRYTGITMPILGSRGCPYECTFCSNPTMWGRRYLTRNPKDVVKEIKYYKEKYGINAVEFYDLTPIIKKSWIVEFCDELIQQNVNIQWQISGGTRCEAIDEEVIVKAKQSGCGYIGFAPESGSETVLKMIKKRVDLKRMLGLIRIAKRHKVDTRCNIIIGFPDETRFQMLKSLLFNWRLAFMGVVDSPIFEFTAYPGSEYFELLRTRGVIRELHDGYFENLGMNIQLTDRMRTCRTVPSWEIVTYRTLGMIVFYSIYYLIRPRKLFQFIGNIFHYTSSNSVFEQRIIQNLRRKLRKPITVDSISAVGMEVRSSEMR